MSLKDKWEERNKKDTLEKATRGANETYQGKLKDQEMEEKTHEKDYFRNIILNFIIQLEKFLKKDIQFSRILRVESIMKNL